MTNFLRRVFARKYAAPSSSITVYPAPSYSGSERSYQAFADEGYSKNVIAFRCIELIASSTAAIPWLLFQRQGSKARKEVTEHPILNLLAKPSPKYSGATFSRFWASYFLISGNSYVVAVGADGDPQPRELQLLRPDLMKVIPGAGGIPAAFEYRVASKVFTFKVDTLGRSPVLHMKTFNPLDMWYGMSPLSAASISVDQLNAGGQWNLSLLLNSARPSLAFTVKTDDKSDGVLTSDQRTQLKKDLERNYAGPANSGKQLLLEGGMDVKELGYSPRDMDFLNSKKTSEKDVALAFGVPGQMVGVEGSQTFSNYEQARLSLYEDTVLPLKRLMRDELNSWLVPAFGDAKLELDIDEDRIDALESRRAQKWDKATKATWLTTNEKRELTNYGEYVPSDDPADQILVPTSVVSLDMLGENPTLEPLKDTEDVNGEAEEEPQKDDETDPAPESDDSNEDETDKGFLPPLNLKSADLRRRFWLAHDRVMRTHEKRLQVGLTNYFKKERIELAKTVDGVDRSLFDFSVNKVLSKTHKDFEFVLYNGLKAAALDAAKPVLALKKDAGDAIEQKALTERFTFSLELFLKNQVKAASTIVTEGTRRRLKKALESAIKEAHESETTTVSLRQVVEKSYDDFTANRADTISRTEVHAAATESSRQAAKALKIEGLKKEWVAAQDERTREGHAEVDGVKVDLDEKFHVRYPKGVDLMEGPGDKSADLSNIINCRCSLVYSTEGGDE